MYVHARKSALELVIERITELKRQNRIPEYVLVTRDEYTEIRDDRRVYSYLENPMTRWDPKSMPLESKVNTVTLKHRRPERYSDRYQHYTFASHESFMGLPLYVVPAEYMPA